MKLDILNGGIQDNKITSEEETLNKLKGEGKMDKQDLVFDDWNNYFGHCLVPEHDNMYCNVKFEGDTFGKNQVMYCKECKICWSIGRNLLSSWRYETDEDWDRNYEMIKDFEYID